MSLHGKKCLQRISIKVRNSDEIQNLDKKFENSILFWNSSFFRNFDLFSKFWTNFEISIFFGKSSKFRKKFEISEKVQNIEKSPKFQNIHQNVKFFSKIQFFLNFELFLKIPLNSRSQTGVHQLTSFIQRFFSVLSCHITWSTKSGPNFNATFRLH